MKKVFLAIGLVAMFAFTGCNEGKKAPQAVKTAMEKLYPGISKVNWDDEDNTWEAEFKNNGVKTSVTFLTDGTLKEIEEEVALADFPQAATDYINQNYPSEKVDEIARMTDAKGVVTYEAEVKDSELVFNTQGKLIKKDGEMISQSALSPDGTGEIAIEDLPAAITQFVTDNHEGYMVKSATYDPLCGGQNAIDVSVVKDGAPGYSLIFTLDGNYVQREEDMDFIEAPAAIIKELKAKYASYQVAPQIEKITLANNQIQYLVDLTKNGTAKEVIFDTDANVVCEN